MDRSHGPHVRKGKVRFFIGGPEPISSGGTSVAGVVGSPVTGDSLRRIATSLKTHIRKHSDSIRDD